MYVYLKSIDVYVQGDECKFTWKVYKIHVYVQGDECTFTWKVYNIHVYVQSDECTFTWKVFTSWDYGIANPEAAHNKVAAIVTGIR